MTIPRALSTRVLISVGVATAAVVGRTTVSVAGRPGDPSAVMAEASSPGVANHPVGVVASDAVAIPAGWPTGPDGSITCATCHDDTPSVGRDPGGLLRDFDEDTADALEFCAKCHAGADGAGSGSPHWMAVRVAHVKHEQERTGGHGNLLDEDSRRCLGCHDGVSASEPDYGTPWTRSRSSFGDSRRNHAIGVRYPTGTARRSSVPFRPRALLPREIRLPDGQVSCVSCHNLYATDKFRLAVPIEQSKLCFACHQLDG